MLFLTARKIIILSKGEWRCKPFSKISLSSKSVLHVAQNQSSESVQEVGQFESSDGLRFVIVSRSSNYCQGGKIITWAKGGGGGWLQ